MTERRTPYGKRSTLEQAFLTTWNQLARHLPKPVEEYRFHDTRRWRFDFAWPDRKVAVECEGGTWTAGRHTRGSGFEGDVEKYNAATSMGWRVFRCTSGTLKDDPAGFIDMVGSSVLFLKG